MAVVNDREYEVLKEISTKMDDMNRELREIKVRVSELSK